MAEYNDVYAVDAFTKIAMLEGETLRLKQQLKEYQDKIEQGTLIEVPENAVVIDKNENPCLSCPVPEDIQRDVDCSTICGAVRLGIDWQNQCKVLVKENKLLTKELAQTRKETAEKFAERMKNHRSIKALFPMHETRGIYKFICEGIDEICKEMTEG